MAGGSVCRLAMLDRVSAGVAQFAADRSLVFCNQPFRRMFAMRNEWLADRPEVVNTDPHGDGWMVVVRVENADELSTLMRAADYERYVKEEGGQ